MAKPKQILFIQYRATLAGAQTSLKRLVAAMPSSELEPVVLLAEHGKLSLQLEQAGIRVHIDRWPSPRSLIARLGGLKRFSKSCIKQLSKLGIQPDLIVANDHQECPLALTMAHQLRVPTLAFMRSSGMTQHDFTKYQCDQIDQLFAVGCMLTDKVNQWTKTAVTNYSEGFSREELETPPHLPAAAFPTRLLVVGTSSPSKGFPDFLQALKLVEIEHPEFPSIDCTFTSMEPTDEQFNAARAFDFRATLNFHGRVDHFRDYVQQFDFAVHPSRSEAFGMAPLEMILAGTPTLSTQTGMIDERILPTSWLTPAHDPEQMAIALYQWYLQWPKLSSDLKATQTRITEQFHIERTTVSFIQQCKSLVHHSDRT